MGDLTVIEQREVAFYDDTVTAVLVEDDGRRGVLVPLGPICDTLGVAWHGQRERIGRDPVLSKYLQGVRVTRTPSPDGRGGGSQTMLCLPLDYLNGWLFGINAARVRPEIREAIIRYQENCYAALAEAFREGRLTADAPGGDALAGVSPETAAAVQLAQAVLALARNQAMMEQRLGGRIGALEGRLETVEAAMSQPGRYVTEDQASQISQAVKAVAIALGKQSGRNEFGSVYGEMYRKFGITGYKMLPARRFEEAMRWLTEWHGEVTGGGALPF